MFVAGGGTMAAAVHGSSRWMIAAGAVATLYWWFKAGDEGCRP